MNLIAKILGIDYEQDIRLNLFKVLSFLCALFSVAGSIANYFNKIGDIYFNSTMYFAIILFGYIHFSLRSNNRLKESHIIILIIYSVFLIDVAYFYNFGVFGSTPNLLIFFCSASILLLPREGHFHYIGIFVINLIIILLIEKYYPEVVVPYPDKESWVADLVIGYFFIIIFLPIALHFFLISFEREQNKTIQANKKLEEANRELIVARKKAEESMKAKSEFLANMSHEIRTPMNAILGAAELLEESHLDEEQKNLISMFKNSGNYLINIINDILDLSEIEAGQINIENIPFDLREILNSIKSIFNYGRQRPGVAIEFKVDESIPKKITGDPHRLSQIIMNLLGNAVKFTFEGKIEVFATRKNDNIYIEIKDTGIGIPADKIPILFERFTQVEGKTTREHGGTGLGLAITKQLTELMGGKIYLESEVGIGTKFYLEIPMHEMTQLNAERTTTKIQIKEDSSSKLNILLAEDVEINRVLVSKMLLKTNYKLEFAVNGIDVVNKYKSNNFDLILMDIQMPDMDGYEASVQIREFELAEDKQMVPIIALTAHALQDFKDLALKFGFNDYLTKPVSKVKLLETIERYANELRK